MTDLKKDNGISPYFKRMYYLVGLSTIITFLVVRFHASGETIPSITFALFAGLINFLVVYSFRNPIARWLRFRVEDKVLFNQLGKEKKEKKKKEIVAKIELNSSNLKKWDVIIYYVVFMIVMHTFIISTWLFELIPSLKLELHNFVYRIYFWIPVLIISLFHFGTVLLHLKNKWPLIYAFFWFPAVILNLIRLYGPAMGLGEESLEVIGPVAALIATYAGLTGALGLINDQIQKRNGRLKKLWNKWYYFVNYENPKVKKEPAIKENKLAPSKVST